MNTQQLEARIDDLDRQMDSLMEQLDKLEAERKEAHAAWQASKALDAEISAFVASVQMQAECKPMTRREAFETLVNWFKDGVEMPKGMTSERLYTEWNRQIENGRR